MKKKGKKRKVKKIVIILAILIILGIAAYFIYNNMNKKSENTENAVAVQSVGILTGAANMEENRFSGMIVSQKTVKLQKEENREVKKVYVEVGQAVKVGDSLFEYDTEDTSAKIDQENLEIEKVQNGITSYQKQIESINARKAEIPAEQHAEYNLEIQTIENDIKQSQYNIKLKQAEIAKLRKALKNTVVKSEIDGVVQNINDKDNNEGDISGENQDNSYMTIMQTGQYRVKGVVNEQNMFSINVGDKVIIHSRVDENKTWTGTIENIDTSNPETNSNNGYYSPNNDSMNKSSKYPFYITLDSMDGLMMGQHVYIEKNIGQENEREGLWLSNYYIVEENGENYVWASNSKDKLEKRKIKIGEKNEEIGEYQILEGLTEDDYIAIPAEGLLEGASVNKFDTMSVPIDMNMQTDDFQKDGEMMVEGGDNSDVDLTIEGGALDAVSEGVLVDSTVVTNGGTAIIQ